MTKIIVKNWQFKNIIFMFRSLKYNLMALDNLFWNMVSIHIHFAIKINFDCLFLKKNIFFFGKMKLIFSLTRKVISISRKQECFACFLLFWRHKNSVLLEHEQRSLKCEKNLEDSRTIKTLDGKLCFSSVFCQVYV